MLLLLNFFSAFPPSSSSSLSTKYRCWSIPGTHDLTHEANFTNHWMTFECPVSSSLSCVLVHSARDSHRVFFAVGAAFANSISYVTGNWIYILRAAAQFFSLPQIDRGLNEVRSHSVPMCIVVGVIQHWVNSQSTAATSSVDRHHCRRPPGNSTFAF